MDWKFESSAREFHKTVNEMLSLGHEKKDLIHQYPAFAGTALLARHLTLYELYKRVLDIPGDIAEIGVFKGGAFLYLAKLCEIFEMNAYTRVYGFDWFKGMDPIQGKEEGQKKGSYKNSYQQLKKLISCQKLDHVAKIIKMDVTKELDTFFDKNKGIKFKLVFLDAGTYNVVKVCLPAFWDRLITGGILILDQYADLRAIGETEALDEYLPKAKLQTFPWSRHPTSFIVKE